MDDNLKTCNAAKGEKFCIESGRKLFINALKQTDKEVQDEINCPIEPETPEHVLLQCNKSYSSIWGK